MLSPRHACSSTQACDLLDSQEYVRASQIPLKIAFPQLFLVTIPFCYCLPYFYCPLTTIEIVKDCHWWLSSNALQKVKWSSGQMKTRLISGAFWEWQTIKIMSVLWERSLYHQWLPGCWFSPRLQAVSKATTELEAQDGRWERGSWKSTKLSLLIKNKQFFLNKHSLDC